VRAQRLQRSRRKGYKTPPNAIYVGRPTKWGNPYRTESYDVLGEDGKPLAADLWRIEAAKLAVRDFREALFEGRLRITVEDVRNALRGKDLICWCPESQECHASVLIEVANS
jgi:hypothetical protein